MKSNNKLEISHLWLTVQDLHFQVKRVDPVAPSITPSMLEASISSCLEDT